jgi:hypothetical protein
VRPPTAESDSQTANLSVRGVRISDLIIERIFAIASLYAASECADGRALIGKIWSTMIYQSN